MDPNITPEVPEDEEIVIVMKEETDALQAEKPEGSESSEDELSTSDEGDMEPESDVDPRMPKIQLLPSVPSTKPLGFGTALQMLKRPVYSTTRRTPLLSVYSAKAAKELQSRTEEEDKINKVIEQGKVTELRDTVQPWRLAKCKTNTLIMSLKTSSKLRSLAKNNLSEGQELKKLGDYIENFACALVEPLEEEKLGSSAIDTVIETSIACNDKKFLSNPVNYNFIVKKWYGRYFRLAKEKQYFLDYCWWIFLHLWSVADIFLSPVVFLVLFTVTWLKRRVQHRRRLLHVPVTEMSQLGGYIEYLETPYFIFVKDSLSYIMLLALHFALCVAKSTTPFSVLEWVILVFFAGRIANEVYQFMLSKDGAKITQTGEEPKSWIKKQFHNYLSDSWNKIDFSTIVIYLITLIMRIITWSIGGEVIHNRTLVVAHYLYGLNASLIAIRAFGHIMETKRYMGPIQIALFKIVSDVGAIVGQFLAIILAFSLALTKLFVAEVSYNTKENTQKSYCKSQGIVCWWQTVKQLIWSLFGMAEVSDLNSFDTVTTAISLTLYVVFLVLAVILLVNMMVALLSNTYQRVEDNSVNEWSYKKAITVMTYKSYHPIIVPMNLISLPIYIIWRKCQKEDTEARKTEREAIEANFDRVVRENLEPHYWAKYGYSYPPTDEDKTDSILNELTGNRNITSKIVEAVFSRPLQGLPFGSNAWDAKGIAVDGCRLWYDCADELGGKGHGAIYHGALTADFPKFEVLIQDFGERRFLSVGLVHRDHNHIIPPGWHSKKTGTVGYHVDDGRVFYRKHVFGMEIPGSKAYRGDLVGCKLLFNRKTAQGGIPVVFSLNGTDLDLGGKELEVKPDRKGEVPLYPFISMGHKGISVLFNLCPSEEQAESYPSELVARSTSPNVMKRLDHLEERMEQLISQMTQLNSNQTQIISQLSSYKTYAKSDIPEKQEDTP